MPPFRHDTLLAQDVLAPTPLGRKQLQESGTSLSPAYLEILVLLDGKSTLGQTAARVRTQSREEVMALCTQMLREGLIEYSSDKGASLDFLDFFQPRQPMVPSAAATAAARDELAATTMLLQQKGYSTRIARRSGRAAQAPPGRKLCVVVIEDEPHLGQVLRHLLAGEGFEARLARNKAEIVAEIRRPPVPDLIVLDVVLPDVDGFDVLERVRRHPALAEVPVIMLTATATREGVLRGLELGADGYVTKPFEVDVLLKAVAAVLGLGAGFEDRPDQWKAHRPR